MKIVEDMSLDGFAANEVFAPALSPTPQRQVGDGRRGQNINEGTPEAGQNLRAQHVAVASQRLHEIRQHKVFGGAENPPVQTGMAANGDADDNARDTGRQHVRVPERRTGRAQRVGQIDVSRAGLGEAAGRTAADPSRQHKGNDDRVEAVGRRPSDTGVHHAGQHPLEQQQIVHPPGPHTGMKDPLAPADV